MARPKAFDIDAALVRAMELFWEQGYAATSTEQLVRTMGISRQSLYDTFGDKHTLFLAAMDSYCAMLEAAMLAPLRAADAGLQALHDTGMGIIDFLLQYPKRRACLMANTTLELAPHDEAVAVKVRAHMQNMEDSFRQALSNAQARGEIAAGNDITALAKYLVAATHGLMVMAKSGAERATLWQRHGDGGFFVATNRWLAEGEPNPADISRDDRLPWIRSQLVDRRVVRFASHADLPPEASVDTVALAQLSIRGAVIVPLTSAGRVIGALSLASTSAERAWPDALIPRVTLLGEIFATVLARDAVASDHLVYAWPFPIGPECEVSCAEDEQVVMCPAWMVGDRLGPGRHRWRTPDPSRPVGAFFVLTAPVEVSFDMVTSFLIPATGMPVRLRASGCTCRSATPPSSADSIASNSSPQGTFICATTAFAFLTWSRISGCVRSGRARRT